MEQLTLTVADLISIRNLIDAACARGTFKANEISSVGAIYDKLDAFIRAAQQQLESQANPEQAQGETNA